MKKIIMFIFFVLFLYENIYSQKSNLSYEFTIGQPNNSIMLQDIQILENSTKLVLFTAEGGSLHEYDSRFFILDKKTNIKYNLKEAFPNFGSISPNTNISLSFDKIPLSTTDIDIIEGNCQLNCWSIYGVRIIKPDSIRIIEKKNIDSLNMSNYLRNQFNQNDFFSSPKGDCKIKHGYNIYSLVNNANNTIDTWELVYENIKVCEDPINPNIIYCINKSNELLKSMDKGNNWILIQNGLPPGLSLGKIFLNPYNVSELYLLTSLGVYKTTDAGFTWSMFFGSSEIYDFVIDFNRKNRFYFQSTSGGIYTKDKEEVEWKKISDNLPKKLIKGTGRTAEYKTIDIYTMQYINFITNSYMLASTEKGTFMTNDNGEHWVLVNNDFILSAYIYKNDVYFGGSKSIMDYKPVLYKSDENGKIWNKIEIKDNYLSLITGIFKDNYHSGLFIASVGKILYIDSSLNVIGLNYGVTKHSNIISQAETEKNGKKVKLALVENKHSIDIGNYGIWISNNNGITWNESLIYKREEYRNFSNTHGLCKLFISPFNSQEFWCFDDSQYYVTFNGGLSWVDLKEEKYVVNNYGCFIGDFSFDYQNKDILYFSIMNYNDYDYSLHRFDRNTRGSTILRESGPYFIVERDNNKNIITSKFEISNDGGWTWKSIYDNIAKYLQIKYYHSITNLPVEYSGEKIILHITLKDNTYTKEIEFNDYIVSYDNGESWQIHKKE
ncbi:MAG: hypothetical protein SO179_08610 [Bacteroidales bacterium]|nr:hypothetical protein [Bacteroidales bacterium]